MSERIKPQEGSHRLAVLIDADNAQASVIEGLLEETAKYGVASVKRIYGDFTAQNSNSWKKVLLKHSINPVQQFAYTTGKNATDSSLIIDAMDLMYTGRFDGMCLVSSDSDFTRLAQRLREEGLTVYGFGERKTPDAFVQACDKFIYTEVLRVETKAELQEAKALVAETREAPAALQPSSEKGILPPIERVSAKLDGTAILPVPFDLLRQAIEEVSDDDGWSRLADVGNYIQKIKNDFDSRLYGAPKLSYLLQKHPERFEILNRQTLAHGGKVLYVKVLSD